MPTTKATAATSPLSLLACQVVMQSFGPASTELVAARSGGDLLALKKAEIAQSLAERVALGHMAGARHEFDRLCGLELREVAEAAELVGELAAELVDGNAEKALAAARSLSDRGFRELAKATWRVARRALAAKLSEAAAAHDRGAARQLGHALTAMGDREIALSIWTAAQPPRVINWRSTAA